MAESVKYRVSCYDGYKTQSCLYEDDEGAKRCAQELQINTKSNKCHLASFREKDETAIANMATTHPITWSLIHDRLEERYDIFNLPESNREKAASLLRENATDWELFPHFLVSAGDKKCSDGNWKKIPYAPTQNKSPLPSDLHLPTELKHCVPSGKYEKDPILKDYTFDIAMDRNCFWNSLVTFVPQTPYLPPSLPAGGPVEILDLGCGIATGALPLVSYFQQYWDVSLTTFLPLQIRYTGVDVAREEIEKAKRINPQNFDFVEMGAIAYLTKQIPQKQFDVVLLRHPGDIRNDWVDHSTMWAEIMHQAYLHLSENGIMIVTNYFCSEYHFTKDLLGNILGAQIYVAGQNPSTFEGPPGSNTRDAYIIVAGKQPH